MLSSLRTVLRLRKAVQKPSWYKNLDPRCYSTVEVFTEPSHESPCSFDYTPRGKKIKIIRKRGIDLLHDPLVNKGTAFPYPERERLKLRGLLPVRQLTMEKQVLRFMDDYLTGKDYIEPADIKDGGITGEHVRRWKLLQELQDRNETLFYRVLLDNFSEMAPIVYTPTVGWACLNYHKLYRRPRGMFFCAKDKGEMNSMMWNWPAMHVDAVVLTDGSRILGLGDLGLNGLGICIGKLDLYCAAAGFHPARVLPIVMDVGTDNKMLQDDPLYMGLKHPRLTGDAYFALLDELVRAIMGRWPKAVLQFEDFNTATAFALLNRYRRHHLVFNDDIQGTAATALAGLYGALRVRKQPPGTIVEQRFVVVGAGSAGMGVTSMLRDAMIAHGLEPGEAAGRFWVLDQHGLITGRRQELSASVRPFARRHEDDVEGESLLSVVRRVKPRVLIGLAGAGRLFSREVLEEMGRNHRQPIILPMSNPTSKMECTAQEAQEATGGRAIFASGSPQPDIEMGGRRIVSCQANNMYIFPGLAMGAHLGATGIVTDKMLMAAAEAVPTVISPQDLALGCVYPRLSDIRQISTKVAVEVMKTANAEGRLGNEECRAALEQGEDVLAEYISEHMYHPMYKALIRLPTGVLE